DKNVRWGAAEAIGSAFQHLTDKDQAWKDLHRLTQDQDKNVRWRSVWAIGSAFQHLTDKDQAWKDLHRLTQDQDRNVRSLSNFGLGRASILKATESIDINDFRSRLDEAIGFFERSSNDATYYRPGAFCLPFYRSLHSILFTEASRDAEIQKYLAEAKNAASNSRSRRALLEAVENLAQALQEVRSYTLDDIVSCKRDLKAYTRYCFKAAECLKDVREDAPFASKIVDAVMVDKSLPILDRRIKALFQEVEEATGRLCKNSKGTELEEFGRSAYESTKGLNEVKSPIAAERHLEDLVPLLKANCNRLPKDAQDYLRSLIESMDSAPLEQRFGILKEVLWATLVQGGNDDDRAKERKELLGLIRNLDHSILTLKMSAGLARKDLFDLKTQIDSFQKRAEAEGLNEDDLNSILEEKDRAMIKSLEKTRDELLREVKSSAQRQASREDANAKMILERLEKQERMKAKDYLGIQSDISSIAGLALGVGAVLL
ncbi:MAG: hypothetical protein HPY61_13670, partial [Methanotrichaceae archaeon]|nr:hypothetical protein [Methanotrichaceae archaeon]